MSSKSISANSREILSAQGSLGTAEYLRSTSGALNVNVTGGGGGATTIADGADVAEGATTDAAVTAGSAGTVSGKLRQISSDISSIKTNTSSVIISPVATGNVGTGVLARASISDQVTTITSSTAAATIVTAAVSNYLDLVSLVFTNTSSTGTEVQLLNDDGTTVRWEGYVPATDMRGIVFSVPFTQTAVNKTWKVITVTSVASVKVTAQFVKNT